jgi:isoquinoline 1-oxidoreductase beta subunit
MRTNAASSVKDGRYYLQLAGAEARERLLLAAANLWGVSVHELTAKDSVITHGPSGRATTYGKIAALAARTSHPNPAAIAIKSPDQWTLMGTEQKNLDVPMKVTGETIYGIDVRLPGMKWAAVKSCPVYGGDVQSYDFAAIRNRPGVHSAVQFPIPDPALTRGRVFSGGVAVIADTWYQAKTALDAMPIEWTIPPRNGAFNSANMRAALLAALDEPGRVRVNQGDVDAAFAGARKIVEATYSTPYLPRARMEPGNATVLVADDRVDIWIGDQSPQETRFSAAQIKALRKRTSTSTCATAGFGRTVGRRPSRRSCWPMPIAVRRSICSGRAKRISSAQRIAPWAWRASKPRSMPTAGPLRSRCARACRRMGLAPMPRSTWRRAITCRTIASRTTPPISTYPSAHAVA